MLINNKNLEYIKEHKEELEASINKKHAKLIKKYGELNCKIIRHVPVCKLEEINLITLKSMLSELTSMTIIRSRFNNTKICCPSDFDNLFVAKISIENWLNDKLPMTWVELEGLNENKTFWLYTSYRYFNSIFVEYCVHKDMQVPFVNFDNQREVEKRMVRIRKTFTDYEFAYITSELGINYEKWVR